MASRNNINQVLPPEILDIILYRLPKADSKTCMFVCSQWYLSSKRSFYKRTTIEGEAVMKRFLDCLSVSDIGIYIEHLKISAYSKKDRCLSPYDTYLLYNECKNLLVLKIDKINPFYILQGIIHNEEALKKLQEISIKWRTCNKISPSVKRAYFLANFMHKSSIKHICLPDNLSNKDWPRGIDKSNYFAQFPQMKKPAYEEFLPFNWYHVI